MGTNCDQDPKKVSKFQWCLSYASCDEMIKKGLCNVGLRDMYQQERLHIVQYCTFIYCTVHYGTVLYITVQ